MLKEEHTDEFFRNRLYDTEVTPPVFVWENVEAELKNAKRKGSLCGFGEAARQ